MQRWCINCKIYGDEDSFYPDAPTKALCRSCVKQRVRDRNKEIFDQADRREREQEALRILVKQVQGDNEPFVYLIEHENKYKIGFSRNINKRMKSFNTSHAIPCKIVGIVPGDSRLETRLHKRFELHHVKGEWFLKKDIILNEFKKLDNAVIFLPGFLKQ